MGVQDRPVRFDAISASQGAASIGLIAIFAVGGGVALVAPFGGPVVIGWALIAIAVVYLVSMAVIGRLARPGGKFAGRFSFRAASHGAAGLCIVCIFGCAGGICLIEALQDDRNAYGISLLIVAVGTLYGFLWFGFLSDSRNLDATRGPEA